MVQLLVDHGTRAVLAYGYFPTAQPGADIVQVDDARLPSSSQVLRSSMPTARSA